MNGTHSLGFPERKIFGAFSGAENDVKRQDFQKARFSRAENATFCVIFCTRKCRKIPCSGNYEKCMLFNDLKIALEKTHRMSPFLNIFSFRGFGCARCVSFVSRIRLSSPGLCSRNASLRRRSRSFRIKPNLLVGRMAPRLCTAGDQDEQRPRVRNLRIDAPIVRPANDLDERGWPLGRIMEVVRGSAGRSAYESLRPHQR